MFHMAILVVFLGVRRGVGLAASFWVSLHCVINLLCGSPSSPRSCWCRVVVDASVTNFFLGRGVGTRWSILSLLYPLTCPAWVSLPGARAPAGIALRVTESLKPPPRAQGWTKWGTFRYRVKIKKELSTWFWIFHPVLSHCFPPVPANSETGFQIFRFNKCGPGMLVYSIHL